MGAIRTLTERQTQTAGMALGGLGTGTVEIRPDGRLMDWHIFNLGKWASNHPDQHGMEDLTGYGEDILPFYIRVRREGEAPVVRKLSHNSPSGGFRSMMYSWMKGVAEISWTPEFPVCRLSYKDAVLPVEVRAEFASPFVPHDSRTSGTPGFYVTFHVKNPSGCPVEVSLLGTLKNPINRGAAQRLLQNRIDATPNGTMLTMASDSAEDLRQNGSLSLAVCGGEHSYLLGDFAPFFGAYVQGGAFGVTEESCLFDFRETGTLPNLGWERRDETLLSLSEEDIDALTEEQLGEALYKLCQLASAARPMGRLKEISEDLVAGEDGKRAFLKAVIKRYNNLRDDFSDSEWGSGTLCSKLTIQPGESRCIRFTVSWHFPRHRSDQGNFVGHQYANWFHNSAEAGTFLCENADAILSKVCVFSAGLLDSNAPPSFLRNWTVQLNTLLKSSWWSEKGDFGIWEGYGSCGFHTTDITYYGSFGLLALFPELQLRQMEMGAAFQRADGRIPHFFVSDFTTVDEGFDRVDMNPQFVLLVCRDYLWTGDSSYLKRLWNAVVRAMDSTERLDGDGDGLPDQDTGANTYDAWKFRGTPAYIGGLWLAALAAGIRMAEAMKDPDRAAHWGKLLEKGRRSFVEKLWNGSYFSLWADGGERDECCMSGQLDGIWYAMLLGLPAILDKDTILQAVRFILKQNFDMETGLINASYPAGAKRTLYTYHNVQADANWSGVEFGFVSFLLELGLPKEAEQLSCAVEERYFLAGRIFNHEECGEYYYRALSSWTILLSLSGFKPDVPGELLTISPVVDTVSAPWFTPAGYGRFIQVPERLEVECFSGELCFRELTLRGKTILKSAELDGKAIPAEPLPGEGSRIRFGEGFRIPAGSKLVIWSEAEQEK